MSIKSWFKKTFEPFFDPAGKETAQSHASEAVQQAEKHLPKHIKEMSVPDLAKHINKLRQPDKMWITRQMASGKIKKHGPASGLGIIHDNNTASKRARRMKQIEKGLIQITPKREYKSSKKVQQQEVSNEGNS